jgi:hypothetical protein
MEHIDPILLKRQDVVTPQDKTDLFDEDIPRSVVVRTFMTRNRYES